MNTLILKKGEGRRGKNEQHLIQVVKERESERSGLSLSSQLFSLPLRHHYIMLEKNVAHLKRYLSYSHSVSVTVSLELHLCSNSVHTCLVRTVDTSGECVSKLVFLLMRSVCTLREGERREEREICKYKSTRHSTT